MLPREYRLPPRTSGILLTTFQSTYFRAKVFRTVLPHARFGFVVSKKVSPLAVERNRIKRKLRAYIEGMLPEFAAGYDILFIIQKEALTSDPAFLQDTLRRFLNERKLLK